MKNIPVSDRKTYRFMNIQATEQFIKNLRWRTHFFQNPSDNPSTKQTFGFKSLRAAPQVPDLRPFESNLLKLIENIKFKQNINPFLTNLGTLAKNIQQEDKVFIPADETSNFYKMNPTKYDELLEKNIQQNYKKGQNYSTWFGIRNST